MVPLPHMSYLLFTLLLVLLSRNAHHSLIRLRRQSAHRCGTCDYPVHGLRRSICPECGTGLNGRAVVWTTNWPWTITLIIVQAMLGIRVIWIWLTPAVLIH